MIKQSVTVVSQSGLHARPANMLVKNSQKFRSEVEIGVGGKTYNAKSMLGVLAAGINCGTEIEIICNGWDEEEACNYLVDLIKNGLGE